MYCEHCGQHCGPDDCPKFINYEAWKFLTDWLHPWHLVLSVVALVVLFGSEESQSMFADSFLADDGPSLLAFGLFGILAVSIFTCWPGAVFWPLRGAIHWGYGGGAGSGWRTGTMRTGAPDREQVEVVMMDVDEVAIEQPRRRCEWCGYTLPASELEMRDDGRYICSNCAEHLEWWPE